MDFGNCILRKKRSQSNQRHASTSRIGILDPATRANNPSAINNRSTVIPTINPAASHTTSLDISTTASRSHADGMTDTPVTSIDIFATRSNIENIHDNKKSGFRATSLGKSSAHGLAKKASLSSPKETSSSRIDKQDTSGATTATSDSPVVCNLTSPTSGSGDHGVLAAFTDIPTSEASAPSGDSFDHPTCKTSTMAKVTKQVSDLKSASDNTKLFKSIGHKLPEPIVAIEFTQEQWARTKFLVSPSGESHARVLLLEQCLTTEAFRRRVLEALNLMEQQEKVAYIAVKFESLAQTFVVSNEREHYAMLAEVKYWSGWYANPIVSTCVGYVGVYMKKLSQS